MVNLRPEVRADKNGRLVTRHVRDNQETHRVIPRVGEKSTSLVTCSFCGSNSPRGTEHRCVVKNLMNVSATTKRVAAACEAAGGVPLIVGGSVRDAVLERFNGGRPIAPKDIDIEVHGVSDPEVLKRELAKLGRVDETGVSFGVLKIRIGDEDFDVSLPRKDSKSGRGHRGFDVEVDPNLSTVEAFGRRDFTVNAIGYDPRTSEIVDPFGGTQDINDGILRHTTDAFADDPLRVLRGVQFASRFGFDLAPETVEECRRIKDDFSEIAKERIWGEFDKILTRGQSITKALQALEDTGWEEHFPELSALHDVPQDERFHPEGNVHIHSGFAADEAARIAERDGLDDHNRRIVVFASLVHDFGKTGDGTQIHHHEDGSIEKITSIGHPDLGEAPIRSFAARIGVPRAITSPTVKLVKEHMCYVGTSGQEPSSRAVRNLIERLGGGDDGATIENWARVLEADAQGRGSGAKESVGGVWVAKAQSGLGGTKPAKSIIDGRTLIERGMKPGEQFREIIDAARQAQIDEVFDASSASQWLDNYLASRGATS